MKVCKVKNCEREVKNYSILGICNHHYLQRWQKKNKGKQQEYTKRWIEKLGREQYLIRHRKWNKTHNEKL